MDIKIPTQTSNEIAANGPIPGDVSLYKKELGIAHNLKTPGYYSTINGAEIADAERSGLFPCATFTGSFDGPNQVYAYRAETTYLGASYINNRKPGEIYIIGGDVPPLMGAMPAGPFIAKADAASGKEIWRTYLDNGNVSGTWIANVNLNIMPNGNIPISWADNIVLIDGDTGEILKHNKLPNGDTPAKDVNYKHLTIAPDGTLIVKDQTRPIGSNLQGTMAIIKGIGDGLKQTNSHMAAVDPETLEVLDDIALPEPASVPHTITMYNDKIAIYVGVNSGGLRYFWDPVKKKLSQDMNWIAKPIKEGQTTPAAISIIGDWLGFQTNGAGSMTIASTIAVVHKDDPNRMNTIFPFGDLQKGQWSFCPPKPMTDPENNMIYSTDMGMGKVAGIELDQKTGELTPKFVLDKMTNTFQPLIGPKDKRIIIFSNIKLNDPDMPVQQAVFSGAYTEQVTWCDSLTGKTLAESDFFEPLTINSLIVPGFGGRFYFPTAIGFLILQVLPKRD